MGISSRFPGMHEAVGHESVESLCPDGSPCQGLLDTLKADLAKAAEATGSDRVPIAARADYLRARDAYRRAVIAWSAASGDDQLDGVNDALEQCRAALARVRR